MDISHTDWELEEMFGSWNSAVWAIVNFIQEARNHRATMILKKVFHHCEDSFTGPINQIFQLHPTGSGN